MSPTNFIVKKKQQHRRAFLDINSRIDTENVRQPCAQNGTCLERCSPGDNARVELSCTNIEIILTFSFPILIEAFELCPTAGFFGLSAVLRTNGSETTRERAMWS